MHFDQHHFWKYYPYLVCVPRFFVKNHVAIGVWVYVWISSRIPLINMSVFVSIAYWFCCCISVLLHFLVDSLQVSFPCSHTYKFKESMISRGHRVHFSQGSLKFSSNTITLMRNSNLYLFICYCLLIAFCVLEGEAVFRNIQILLP